MLKIDIINMLNVPSKLKIMHFITSRQEDYQL